MYPFICWQTLVLFLPFSYCDSAAVNIHVQVVIWTLVFNSLGSIPKSGIAGSLIGSFAFQELPNAVQQWLHNYTSLLPMYKGFNVPTPLATLVLCWWWWWLPPYWVWSIIIVFALASPWWPTYDIEHFFMCLWSICVSLRKICSSSLHVFF